MRDDGSQRYRTSTNGLRGQARLRAALLALGLIAIAISSAPAGTARPAENAPKPNAATKPIARFADVQKMIKHWQTKREHLGPISRSEAEDVMTLLGRNGWRPGDAGDLVKLVLPDGHFLIRQLRTSAGQRFVKRYGDEQGLYDHMHRLTGLPQGELQIQNLLVGPEGNQRTLVYMASDKAGSELWHGYDLEDARKFNQPTGRIYTVAMLVEHLRKSYEHDHDPTARR